MVIGLVEGNMFTGNKCFSYEIWGFPADFLLKKSNEMEVSVLSWE